MRSLDNLLETDIVPTQEVNGFVYDFDVADYCDCKCECDCTDPCFC